jgi:4-amino-4-deoxy-L-arabinose transferase-like glycosyltransferase
MSARARIQRRAFLLLGVILGVAAFIARAMTALGTQHLLDWDETYYASTTSTAAHGLGFYPYVLGYAPIPNMGGIGYVISLYVLAYKVLGADLLSLRLMSFLASVVAVIGLFVLTRRLYGTAAGVAALAVAPSLMVFQLSNTIRLDVFAVAFVAWALVLYSYAAEKPERTGWHVLVGAVFALGLQVHLHTAAAAFAVGLAYLVYTIGALRRGDRHVRLLTSPVAGFVAGYALGACLFLILNVLPNPQGFFRTAALARLSAADSGATLNLTAPMDFSKLVRTFFSPLMIVPKEIARYRSVVGSMPLWEILLWLAAIPAFMIRRMPPAYDGRLLLGGAILGGGIVFNGASPLYVSAILPFFVPAAATFITHPFTRKGDMTWPDISGISVALLLVLSLVGLPPMFSRASLALSQVRPPRPAIVDAVKHAASPECILAGPTDLYAQYFMDYPKFVGTREVEVLIGSTYYDLQGQAVRYWYRKEPDIVFGTPAPGLGAYLEDARYERIAENVWKKPDTLSEGCRVTVR